MRNTIHAITKEVAKQIIRNENHKIIGEYSTETEDYYLFDNFATNKPMMIGRTRKPRKYVILRMFDNVEVAYIEETDKETEKRAFLKEEEAHAIPMF